MRYQARCCGAFYCVAALFVLFVCSFSSFADDRQPPASWTADARAVEPLDRLHLAQYPALDIEALAFQDSLSEAAGEPPRFAFPHAEHFDLHGAGNWDRVGDTSIWRMRVRAEDAVLLNFGFSDLYLPEGARLYIYTAAAAEARTMDRYAVIGPYTAAINRPHGEFWTPNLHADDVIIELNVATAQRDFARFEINQVSHGYRAFGAAATDYWQQTGRAEGEGKQSCKDEGGARSGACNMDVACLADDDPWNDPRRSVGAYSRSGIFACTGSLVNNTAGDQRMLFMTATHCINSGQAPSIVVYWNYEWPTCRTPGASGGTATNSPDPNVANSGGTWLAATTNPFQGQCSAPDECSDFTLIELDDDPDPDWDLYWSGWDRRGTPVACGPQGDPGSTDGLCASIHHPGVHEKRITFVAQDIQIGNIAGAQGIHWHPFWHPNPPVVANIPEPQPSSIPPGVTEGGSSGSPLYTAEQRFIGVLSGGLAFCGATGSSLSDLYGQLAHAWEGTGTPTTRMRDHLDPLGTNPEFIDGIGADGFEMVPEDTQISQCGFDDLDIVIDIAQIGAFDQSVALSTSGLPAGVSAAFSDNNQPPPFATVLTLSGLAAAGAGEFTFALHSEAGDVAHSVDIEVTLFDGATLAPGLFAPADGMQDIILQPEFAWESLAGAAEYRLQVATDAGFADIVIDETLTEDGFVPEDELDTGTQYYWRVRGLNACGEGGWSDEFSFTTRLDPAAQVSPASLTFEVPQNHSDSQALGISNTGTGNLVWSITTGQAGCDEDPDPVPWLSADPDAGSTAADQTDEASANVDASGLAPGQYAGHLCVTTNAAGQPLIAVPVDLTVTEGPPPELAVNPEALDFGPVGMGGDALLAVTVSNVAAEGALDLELAQIAVIAGAPEFEIADSDCDTALSAQESCTVQVRFTPSALVPYAGILRIAATGQTVNVELSGSGSDDVPPVIFEDRFEAK